jgi:hypothetical protein
MSTLHPQMSVLKDVTGNVSFFARLRAVESPRLAWFGPDGRVTPLSSVLAHTS